MSVLNFTLGVLLIISTVQAVRLYRRQMILRHVFIRSSDWCALKIDEMIDSAAWSIMDLVQDRSTQHDQTITDEQARGAIPYTILNAKKEWLSQKEAFQAQLARNGIKPLDLDDLDGPIWNPRISGIRP